MEGSREKPRDETSPSLHQVLALEPKGEWAFLGLVFTWEGASRAPQGPKGSDFSIHSAPGSTRLPTGHPHQDLSNCKWFPPLNRHPLAKPLFLPRSLPGAGPSGSLVTVTTSRASRPLPLSEGWPHLLPFPPGGQSLAAGARSHCPAQTSL